jgi:hypothetical protein
MIRKREVGDSTGSTIDEIYASLASDMKKSSDPIETVARRLRDEAPSDEEVKAVLESKSFAARRSKRTRYILTAFENHHFKEQRRVDSYDVEIEHVAPRKPFGTEKYKVWTEYLDVGKEEYQDYKNRLGNLTILEERLNKEASDNPYEEKKTVYKNSGYGMTEEIADKYEEWSIENIQERTEDMAEIATDIWNFEV